MTSYVSTDIDGPIAVVTLNRPDKHNAFDDSLIADLTDTFKSLDANAAVRVVVLSAAGKSFSASAHQTGECAGVAEIFFLRIRRHALHPVEVRTGRERFARS